MLKKLVLTLFNIRGVERFFLNYICIRLIFRKEI